MSEIKLKPCPCCGGEARLTAGTHCSWIKCECGIQTQVFKTKEQAIESWNTRKPMERIVEQVERMSNQEMTIEEALHCMKAKDRKSGCNCDNCTISEKCGYAVNEVRYDLIATDVMIEALEKQMNNGWIPCTERLPANDNDAYILLSFENFSVPCVGRYREDEDGGAFYIGDEDETCISQDMYVNAWMPLPAPYRECEQNG